LVVVCCECCVLSGGVLCDWLITRPEESYRLWCVVVCDLETSWMRRPWPTEGLSRQKQKQKLNCWYLEPMLLYLYFSQQLVYYISLFKLSSGCHWTTISLCYDTRVINFIAYKVKVK